MMKTMVGCILQSHDDAPKLCRIGGSPRSAKRTGGADCAENYMCDTVPLLLLHAGKGEKPDAGTTTA